MTNLRYAREAHQHIASIHAYIANHNPQAATGVIIRIRHTAQLLVLFPGMGHRGTVSNTYELVVKGLPYVIVYELRRDKDVVILGIFHGARSGREI